MNNVLVPLWLHYLTVGIKAWSRDLEGDFILCPLVQFFSNKIGFSHIQIGFNNLLSQLSQAVGQHFFSRRQFVAGKDRRKWHLDIETDCKAQDHLTGKKSILSLLTQELGKLNGISSWKKKSRLYEFSSVDISILPALETSPIICWIVSTYMAYSRVFPAQMWMFHFTGGDLFRHHDPLAHWPPWQMYQSTNYVVQESSTTKYSRQTAKTSLDCLRCFAFQKMLLKSDLCFLITSFTMLIVLGKDSFSSCSCTICQ